MTRVVCGSVCLYMCLCVCKIRPGEGEFQSVIHRIPTAASVLRGASELTGLFIAFHDVPRAESVVGVEERSQVKICCQAELMYSQQHMATFQNLH